MAKVKLTSLDDNEDLKEKISQIARDLDSINVNNSGRHLADVGCSLRSLASELTKLTKEVFDRHKQQSVAKD